MIAANVVQISRSEVWATVAGIAPVSVQGYALDQWSIPRSNKSISVSDSTVFP